MNRHIEKTLSPERKQTIIDRLRNIDTIRNTPTEDQFTARVRELMAQEWVESGALQKQTRDFMMSEIIGALVGVTTEQRHERRMQKIICDRLGLNVPE